MLQCHIIQGPDIKSQVIDSLMQEHRRWIVSDLDTKFWMQSYLREKESIICSDHVLRASELWQKLLLEIDPHWQILPVELTPYLIEKWMKEVLQKQKLSISSKDFTKAYQTMGQILPLLSHEHGQEAISEWFAQSEEAQQRWYEWYQLGTYLWQIIKVKKMIPLDWMKAILLNEVLDDLKLSPFVFDLGQEIDDVESELILNLSRLVDIDLIIPASEIENECYANLISRSQCHDYEKEESVTKRFYKKFPSQLSEVKDAVATVRNWLDQKVDPQDIAIVSPIIENYWPTLSEYLQVEGIAFNKAIVTPLSQFEVYQYWLSKMRLALDDMNKYDGQQILFLSEETPTISYDKFLSLFANVYDISDYKRSKTVQKEIPKLVNSQIKVTFPLFLEWSFSLLPSHLWNELVERLPDFDDIYFVKEELEFEKWVEFFANYFARNEAKIIPANPLGISILSLSGALNRPLKKIYNLGLSEKSLKENLDTALQWSDIESIKLQFGFNLPHADRFKTLDQLSWMEYKATNEMHLSLAETDFSGQFQAPSLFWLKGAILENHKMELDTPSITRWDQLMKNQPEKDWLEGAEHFKKVDQGIRRDLGEISMEKVKLNNISLSASQFEEYFKCPFRFFAAKALHLTHLPSLDLDIDAMTRGRLMHKVCELLLLRDTLFQSLDEIEKLVELARKEIDMSVYNGEVWSFLKPYYIKLTQQFMNAEIQWRQEYPATKTFALEKFIETTLEPSKDGFYFTKEGKIPFRGVIDRIDTNSEGEFAIIDYKSSDNGLTQYGSWLKNGKIQLALYSLALIEGALDGEPKDVVGAFYFVLKGLDRTKGFAVTDSDPKFLPSKKMDRDSLNKLLEETKILVGDMLHQILDGNMEPKPSDEKICETCNWNKICRYPQLNH